MIMSNPASLPPGFRFHPTDEELILHYLRNRAASAPCSVSIIADVDIYKFDPWDLPSMALYGDREWYFFSPRDRKYPNGIRPNRAAGSGYWKATGTDKPIHNSVSNENIGVKKALVFYRGRPPKGTKTNWIMHEYRLADAQAAGSSSYKPMKFRNASMRLDDWVLCRIYKKSSHVSPMAPPLSDHEQDEPCSFEDNMLAPSSAMLVQAMSTPTGAFHPHGASTQRALPKIPSISELLDEYTLAQLFDGGSAAAPEMARPEHPPGTTLLGDPAMNQLLLPNNIAQLHQMDASASPAAGEGSGKRKCSGEGGDAALLGHPPAKKPNGSCFGATLAAQGSLGQVPGLSHQLLLRSNLGMN